MRESPRVRYALLVLFAINALNFYDRQILSAVAEPLRREWRLSDGAIGALTTAFTLLYAFVGVPFGRLADRARRNLVLAGGVFAWSLLTAASGLARSFWQLFALRLSVGIGEASCAPAATSLIGDLVPRAGRARALSIFMLGLPAGLALSYLVSSAVAARYSWRAAFLVAGLPGLLLALAALLLREPERGGADAAGTRVRPGSAYRVVLSVPTVWWIILSGALHNFNLYAISAFLSPLLMRYHGLSLAQAGLVSMLIYGVAGGLGLLAGGFVGDWAVARRRDGRLLAAGASVLLAVPLLGLALAQPPDSPRGFAACMGLAIAALYVYYAVIYAALHDVVEPALRGTAMSLYFLAMYFLGASLGPLATGLLSDRLTARAAAAAGSLSLEPFRAAGLHDALLVVPLLALLLALVLYAGSRSAGRDAERLDRFLKETPAEG